MAGRTKPSPGNTKLLKLSEAEDGTISVKRVDLQERAIKPIIRFFVGANVAMFSVVVVLAFLEHFLPTSPTAQPVVTDKVLIAAIGGISIQAGAILIAAFRELFKK